MDGIARPEAGFDATDVAAAAPAFDCDLVTDASAIDALRPEWDALATRVQATAFQSFGFLRAAIATMPSGASPLLAVVRTGARLAAVLPLERRHRLGFVSARGLGAPYAQYDDALADPAVPGAVAAALGRLVDTGAADALVFRRVREGSALAAALAGRARAIGEADQAPYVALGGFGSIEAFVATLSGKKRQNLRRGRAKLAEAGAVAFAVHRGADALPRAAEAIAMKRAWLAETGRVSPALADTRIEALFAALVAQAPETLAVSVLSVAGRPAACEIGLVAGRRYHAFLGALDQRLAEASPGSVQMHETLAWCIGEGLESYDLLPPADAYKARWTELQVPVADLALALTPAGAAHVRLWHGGLRPALKRGFAALPGPVRRVLSRLA